MDVNMCGQCGKTFKYRRNLLAHERGHSGLLPFSCCGIGFPSRRRLDRHRCTAHREARSYICSTCDKKFATQDDLNAHQRRERKAKMVSCNTCSHKCSSNDDMKEHLKTHAKEKTRVCRDCGASFKHMSSLSRHIRKNHK